MVIETLHHDHIAGYVAAEHFLQTAITNVSIGLATGILTVVNGTGALGVIANNSGNWDAAFSHISNDGSDHSFIDQSVVNGSSPTFVGTNFSGIPDGALSANVFLADGTRPMTGDLDMGVDNIIDMTGLGSQLGGILLNPSANSAFSITTATKSFLNCDTVAGVLLLGSPSVTLNIFTDTINSGDVQWDVGNNSFKDFVISTNSGQTIFRLDTLNGNTTIGAGAGNILNATTAFNNTFTGALCGNIISTQDNNTGYGYRVMEFSTASGDAAFGLEVLREDKGSNNSSFGPRSFSFLNTSSADQFNLGLGYFAGHYQRASNRWLFLDTLNRGTAAAEITDSLLYGIFHATPTSQSLTVNGTLKVGNATNNQASQFGDGGVTNYSSIGSTGSIIQFGSATATLLQLEVTNNVGFYGTTPVTQNQLQTGVGATVDNIITELQRFGLVRQAA